MSRLKLPIGTWFCIALGVFWVFAIIPGMIRARDLPGELAASKKKLEDMVTKRTRDAQAQKATTKMGEEFGPLLTGNVAMHSAFLLRESYRVCVESKTRLISVQPLAPTVRGEFMKYPVQLNMEGDLKGVTKLLLLLRDARPVLDPERVTMRTNADGKKINAQLTVASFAWAPKGKAKRRV